MADEETPPTPPAPVATQPPPVPAAPPPPATQREVLVDFAAANEVQNETFDGPAMQAALKKANKEAMDLRHKLQKLEQSTMTEQEKAIAQARAEARQEALGVSTERLVRAEVRAAAAGKLADPADAVYLIGDLTAYVTSDGDADTKAISKAIDELVKSKPYLAPQGSKPAPLPGGGATPSDGFSMDDWLRGEAHAKGRR